MSLASIITSCTKIGHDELKEQLKIKFIPDSVAMFDASRLFQTAALLYKAERYTLFCLVKSVHSDWSA